MKNGKCIKNKNKCITKKYIQNSFGIFGLWLGVSSASTLLLEKWKRNSSAYFEKKLDV